jgi:competence protein ComEC
VRARIEHTFARSVVPHARALVLGENDMSDHERLAFRTSGLSHLLAVSGTHLILAVLALGRLVRALLARCEPLAARWDVGRLSAALCIPACWLYADFAGGGGSAYRAAAMLTVAMGARAAGRRPSAQRAFAWSLLGAGLLQPLAMFDLSFGLSVAATTGLLVWGRSPAEDRKGWQRALGLGVAAARATAAATIACLPIVLTVNGELPVLSVVANLLAGPLGELAALPLCLLHAVVWWLPSVEAGAALLGSGALTAVRAVAHAAADSGAMIELPPPTAWQLITLVLAGVVIEGQGLARAKHRWKTMALAALILGLLEGCAMLAGAPPGELRVTALDVGQGDAILVDLPDGRVMLVDGGGLVGSPINTGERVVLEVLRARRRRALDVVVLSHPHPDHYGGLLTVLSRLPVGELWISGLETQSVGPVTTAIHDAAKRGTRVRLTRELCGNPQSFGAARVDVLGPCPTFDRAASVNDNSVVLRVALGRRAALLAGDAEAPQEARLLAAHGQRLRADLLKVGHHGSRTSTSEAWLDAVGPTTAMISCGVRNRFGHPHAPTLRHLARFWVAVFRTDRGGAVVWQTDGIRWGAAHHRSSLQMEEH